MTIRRGVSLAALGALLLPAAAAAAGLPADPILRIETGAHIAPVNRVVAMPEGDQVFTVSDDKTARLWSLDDGRLIRTLRPPIGAGGAEGALYAGSVTGSGRFFALAGHTGFADRGHAVVYLLRRSGKWVGAIPLPGRGAVNDLAFSPGSKSRYLAVATQDAKGLQVVELKSPFTPRVVDDGYEAGINRLAFSPAGMLASTSDDGHVRLYDESMQALGRYQVPDGARPWSLSFSPDATRLAVGYLDRAEVHVLSIPEMTLVKRHAGRDDRQGGFGAVAWSLDGSALFAAGYYGSRTRKLLARWAPGEDGPPAETDLAGDTVTDLMALWEGAAFATAEGSWGTVTADGRTAIARTSDKADFRDAGATFLVHPDGSRVEFGLAQGGRTRVRLDLTAGVVARNPITEPALASPVVRWSGGAIEGYRNTTRPRVGGRAVTLGADEIARSAAYDARTGTAVVGTDFSLRAYAADGTPRWQRPLPAAAWAVNIAAGAGLVVAGLGDGTLRWYRIDSGEPTLGAFVDPARSSWIAWTPEGFFDDQGQGASTLIGYHVNRLGEKGLRGADFVSVDQVYQLYARTDLVAKKVRGDAADEIASEAARIGGVASVIERGLPPRVAVTAYCTDDAKCADLGVDGTRGDGQQRQVTVEVPTVKLKLALADLGGGVGEIAVRRQGARVATVTPTAGDSAEVEIALEPGLNPISISARNGAGEIETPAGERPGLVIEYVDATKRQPTLHLLAIGVNEYRSPTVTDLRFAAKDARGVAEIMSTNDGTLYENVRSEVVVDAEATQQRVIESLAALEQRVRPFDLALVFLAGHGTTVNGQYYFLPADLPDLPDDAAERDRIIVEHGISQERLTTYLGQLQATRTLIVLDTCYAGAFAVSDSTLSRSRDQTVGKQISHASGRFVLAASSSLELAIDGYRDHGLFTRIVLDGLAGEADQARRGDQDGRINIYELGEYAKERVPRIAATIGGGHEQTPRWYFAGDEMFDIRSTPGG